MSNLNFNIATVAVLCFGITVSSCAQTPAVFETTRSDLADTRVELKQSDLIEQLSDEQIERYVNLFNQSGDINVEQMLCKHYTLKKQKWKCAELVAARAYAGDAHYQRRLGTHLVTCGMTEGDRIEGLFWLTYASATSSEEKLHSMLVLATTLAKGDFGFPRLPKLAHWIFSRSGIPPEQVDPLFKKTVNENPIAVGQYHYHCDASPTESRAR